MREKIVQWIAWRLPRSVAYWATIRVGAHATQVYPNTVVPDLTLMEALKRWNDDA